MKSENENLDSLVQELQENYDRAIGDYVMGGMFSRHVYLDQVDLCKKLVTKINELYQTSYEIKINKYDPQYKSGGE